MTITKSIFGIVLFAIQISIATFYNGSVDLKIIIGLATLTFGYVGYKFLARKYDSA